MKKENYFQWFMLTLMIAVTVLILTGCRDDQTHATLYCYETNESITLSVNDTQELLELLDRSYWKNTGCCEYLGNYSLRIGKIEYWFETLDYDPIYGELISYSTKGGVLAGIVPREGIERYKQVLEILRRNCPE